VTINFAMPVRLSVCLSAWNNSAPIGRIFVKFYILVFFENLSRKFKFRQNLTRIMDTLHDDQYTFLILSRSILHRMRNVAEEVVDKIKTQFVFNNGESGSVKTQLS